MNFIKKFSIFIFIFAVVQMGVKGAPGNVLGNVAGRVGNGIASNYCVFLFNLFF
jgi:hypothetical protein